MGSEPVALQHVNHHFGRGTLARQILFDLCVEIRAGEIAILTGPSGSGKTTALTLIGALRTAREGSVRVLGEEIVGAKPKALVRVRRQIGYIFQQHNLLESLTAGQNVQMSLQLHPGLSRREQRQRADEMLEAVGLGGFTRAFPSKLSGGQKQRVAIARALVSDPKLVLADEPTASLDSRSGRDVVTLMQRLAQEKRSTVVLVTHDSRILDVADRILHLEDGRLVSFGNAVLAETSHMMKLLAEDNRKGELARRVEDMRPDQFSDLLARVTREAEHFLQVSRIASGKAFESMLDQMLLAFTRKIGEILEADRASLFMLDEARGELWSKAARDGGGDPTEIRIPRSAGLAGAVLDSGEAIRLDDAYDDPRFVREVDGRTGYRTRSLMCVPLRNLEGRVFAVAQALNKRGGEPFSSDDQRRFTEFMASVSVVLESWWRMSQRPRDADGASPGTSP